MGELQQHDGGWRWRVDIETGLILAEQEPQTLARLMSTRAGDLYIYRTKGKPSSMVSMWEEHGDAIAAAAECWDFPPQFLMALIGIEAVRGHGLRWDNQSLRKEPGYLSDELTPRKVSPGLLQTLITTARGECKKRGLYEGQEIDRELLFRASASCMIGGAYFRRQLDRYGFDPIRSCGAYNAGRLKTSDESPWRIRTYGPTRIDRYIAWSNDSVEVLNSLGIWTGLVQVDDTEPS